MSYVVYNLTLSCLVSYVVYHLTLSCIVSYVVYNITLSCLLSIVVHNLTLSCLVSFVVYHALFLDELTVLELKEKMAALFSVPFRQLRQVYKQGPTGIHVLVTDEVGLWGVSLLT